MSTFSDQNTPQDSKSVFITDDELLGKTIKSTPAPKKEIGIDVNKEFYTNILEAAEGSQVDISKIESFTQASQDRELMYEILDTMGEDTTIAAVLETYAEDATEASESGKIMWCQSDDPDVNTYVTYLLDSLNIDKNIFKYAYCLCKYGDVYLRLYRKSDIEDNLFDSKKGDAVDHKTTLHEDIEVEESSEKDLNEAVILNAYPESDKYVHYVEMTDNPAEMFELTKFGKSYAYIKADVRASQQKQNPTLANTSWKYSFNKADVNLFDATCYVHGALEDNFSRFPETVDILLPRTEDEESKALTYTVKKGQSLLYNVYRIWRCLMLLENSLLLNRLTKSSIIRIIGVEVGDMPKENVGKHMMSIKQLLEQKSALDTGNMMTEYTNPGPMENCVYVPTHNGIGAITTEQVGGDVDVKGLGDIDYFKNKMFSGLKVPKQYFGDTDDSAGFNGGTSLSLISSRYAKTIKRIQNTLIQMITDAINLMLLDRNLSAYVNKFELHMQAPTTQEEVDRRDNAASKVQITQDIMGLLEEIEDPVTRLKVLKILLSDIVENAEVMKIINEQIEKLEEEDVTDEEESDMMSEPMSGPHMSGDLGAEIPQGGPSDLENPDEPGAEDFEQDQEQEEVIGDLPRPDELGIDFTNSDEEI